MSRNKNSYSKSYDDGDYDDDDYYDYDDYDYNDNQYSGYDNSKAQNNLGTNGTEFEVSDGSTIMSIDIDDSVKFLMETLGNSHFSEPRIRQMLSLYDNNFDKTLNYFLKQKNESCTALKTSSSSSAKASTKKAIVVTSSTKDLKYVKQPPLTTSSIPTKSPVAYQVNNALITKEIDSQLDKMTSVQINDLEDMGLGGSEFINPELRPRHVESITSTLSKPVVSAASSNHTQVMSDDDYDTTEYSISTEKRNIHLTLIVAGHVDAGKSTLVGKLLHLTGIISNKVLQKNRKESQVIGKSSFALAWAMDESKSERERGVTIDIAERELKLGDKVYTILDSPGHRDFIPSMISGAVLGDVALLVIPARPGEYESSTGASSQTKEHALLLRALGVNEVLIVVNKMDETNPPFSQDRYLHIVTEITYLLKDLQFRDEQIRSVPVSAVSGENFIEISPACVMKAWYSGPTLLDAINSFSEPIRENRRPLRAVVTAILSENPKGVDVSAKVLQGCVRIDRRVGIAPSSDIATVKKIYTSDGTNLNIVHAGQQVNLKLVDSRGQSGAEMHINEGCILYKTPPAICSCNAFKAVIMTIPNLVPPIIPGSSIELFIHGDKVQGRITKFYYCTSAGQGNEYIRYPKVISGDRTASVRIETERNICISLFEDCRALGRFALRSKGQTIAIGICVQLPRSNIK